MLAFRALVVATTWVASLGARQAAIHMDAPASPHELPAQRLASLTSEFTTLRHPLYAEHSVRVARTHGFCDTTVR
jgi:hypothetical protein